jgi:hypothetical protein
VTGQNPVHELAGLKGIPHRTAGHWTNPAEHEGVKVGGGASGWFGENSSPMRQHWSGSKHRKAASAMIAKIPLPLSRHIATVYYPGSGETTSTGGDPTGVFI